MSSIECFLCLEIQKDLSKCIKIGSSQWNDQHIENVMEKHLWPLTFLKSKSQWMCYLCWTMLDGFHDFYKRVKNANECYDYIVTSQNEMEIDAIEEIDIEDSLIDAEHRPPDRVLHDNTDIEDEEIEENIQNESSNQVFSHETVLLENVTDQNNHILQTTEETEDDTENSENPLELAISPIKSMKSSKHFVTKYFTYNCALCDASFEKFTMLQQHFYKIHNKQEAYVECCGTKFNSGSIFGEHIKNHNHTNSFKVLKNNRNIATHIARLHKNKLFHCLVCNRKFTDESKYNKHKTEHEDILEDSNCGETSNNDNDYLTETETELPNEFQTDGDDCDEMPPIPEQHDINNVECDTDIACEKAEKSHTTTTPTKPVNIYLTIESYLRVNSKYDCDICKEACDSFSKLQQHFGECHKDQAAYVVCCGVKFISRTCLSVHTKTHLSPNCYQCQYCKLVLKNKRNLKAHINSWHTPKNPPSDECGDKNSITKTEYIKQKREAIEKDILNKDIDLIQENIFQEIERDKITCNETDVALITNNLYDHEDTEMSLEITDFGEESTLEDLSTSKSKFDELYEEISLKNKSRPENIMAYDNFLQEHIKFTCHLCDNPEKIYENFVKLRQHFSIVHNIEGYVYCCGAKHNRRRVLVEHIKGHLDSNYFKCTYCARVLKTRRGLLNHLAIHERKVRRCKICSKAFYDPIQYEKHYLAHKSNKESDYDEEDELPLIQTIGREMPKSTKKNKEEVLENETIETNDTNKTLKSEQSLPDYSKNIQRRLEHDEFLAKHFKIVCHACEDQTQIYQTFALLRQHFALVHKEEPYMLCCAFKFKKRDALVQHIQTHLNPNEFTCEFCSKVLKTKRNLRYHIAACHEGKTFRCEICSKKFINEFSYKSHRKNHKTNEKTTYTCPHCGKTYKHNHVLTHHINTFHLKRYARLCDICGTFFGDINLFNAHMKSRHMEDNEKEKYPCKICGRIMAARQSLRLHMKTQHSEAETYAFTCHICSKPMATKGLLNYHLRTTHQKVKPHKCHICGKNFKESKQLRGHMGTHTGESIYKCNFCPKAFNSTGHRSKHRNTFHPKEWEEFKKKMYTQSTASMAHDQEKEDV